MIKLVVGLGNPGQQYEKTRHNVGFWFLDHLLARFNAKWSVEKKFHGRFALIELAGQKIYLLKPDTYMNLSGQSVVALMRYYGIGVKECLVVHDELDFDPSVVRVKKGGGHAGHNGLKSIVGCVGCSDFIRLRFGIGRPKGEISVADFVLSVPSRADMEKIEGAIDRVLLNFDLLAAGELELVMRELHA